MTGLARLDGPETAAVSDQLVDVYRASPQPDPPASGPPVGEATSPAE